MCRCNAGGRQRSASEQSLAQILNVSNWVFIVYSVTMLVIVCHRSDPFVAPEAFMIILIEIFARIYVFFVIKEEFNVRASAFASVFLPGIEILQHTLFVLRKVYAFMRGFRHNNIQPPAQLCTPIEATEIESINRGTCIRELDALSLHFLTVLCKEVCVLLYLDYIHTIHHNPPHPLPPPPTDAVPTSMHMQCSVAAQSEPDPTATLVMNSDQPRNTYRNTVPTESFLDPPSRPLMEDVLRRFY